MKKLISLLLILALSLGCIACAKGGGADPEVQDNYIMKSEHYTITPDVYQYFLAFTYSTFYNQYSMYINSILDTSSPLRDQESPFGGSWFDYMTDNTTDSLLLYMVMAEQAIEEGIALSEDEERQIADQVEEIVSQAAEAGYDSEEAYLQEQYGSLITKDTLLKAFQLFFLSNKYHEKLYNGYTYTEQDYAAYAEENPDKVYVADFLCLRIGRDYGEDATQEQLTAAMNYARAHSGAMDAELTDRQSFFDQAELYFREVYTIVPDSEKPQEDDEEEDETVYTESELASLVANCELTAIPYNVSAANGQWVFDPSRKAGDHAVIDDPDTGCCEVYLMLKPLYLQEDETVNVRHILLDESTSGSMEEAKQQAEELLEQWRSGSADEDYFAELAMQYTADTASASAGGLYEGVMPGDMVEEFDAWCFDPARKEGDTDIVKTDYGYHIMYFVSHGLPAWQGTADSALRQADFDEEYERLSGIHSVDIRSEKINDLPDLT